MGLRSLPEPCSNPFAPQTPYPFITQKCSEKPQASVSFLCYQHFPPHLYKNTTQQP